MPQAHHRAADRVLAWFQAGGDILTSDREVAAELKVSSETVRRVRALHPECRGSETVGRDGKTRRLPSISDQTDFSEMDPAESTDISSPEPDQESTDTSAARADGRTGRARKLPGRIDTSPVVADVRKSVADLDAEAAKIAAFRETLPPPLSTAIAFEPTGKNPREDFETVDVIVTNASRWAADGSKMKQGLAGVALLRAFEIWNELERRERIAWGGSFESLLENFFEFGSPVTAYGLMTAAGGAERFEALQQFEKALLAREGPIQTGAAASAPQTPETALNACDVDHENFQQHEFEQLDVIRARACDWQLGEALRLADEFALRRRGATSKEVTKKIKRRIKDVLTAWRKLGRFVDNLEHGRNIK